MRDRRWGVAGPREGSGVAGLGFSTLGKVYDWGTPMFESGATPIKIWLSAQTPPNLYAITAN